MLPFAFVIFSSLVYPATPSIGTGPLGKSKQKAQKSEKTKSVPKVVEPSTPTELRDALSITPPQIMPGSVVHQEERLSSQFFSYGISSFLSIDQSTIFGIGIHYAPKSWNHSQIDLHFDSVLNLTPGWSRFHITYRKALFSPFWKWGFRTRIIPRQKLASFVNPDNYFMRIGAGIRSIFSTTSWDFELEGFLNFRIRDPGVLMAIGYSF